MRLSICLTKGVVIGCVCAGTLVASACTDGRGAPTSPGASAAVTGLAPTAPANQGAAGRAVAPALSARSGDLHVTKNCSQNTGQPGSFCTITSSNVKAIEVGSRVVYASGGRCHSAGQRCRPRPAGSGQQQGVRPLQTRFCDPCRAVHVLGRDREVHALPSACRGLGPRREELGLGRTIRPKFARLNREELTGTAAREFLTLLLLPRALPAYPCGPYSSSATTCSPSSVSVSVSS